MPLIKCATCGHSIADNAVACPSCGAPNSAKRGDPKEFPSGKTTAPPQVRKKKVGVLLGLAIFLIPFIFAPITLFAGYSKTARIVALGWLSLIFALIFLAGQGAKEGEVVASTPAPQPRAVEASGVRVASTPVATKPPSPVRSAPPLPSAQQALLDAVEEARKQYRNGTNDLAKGAARPARAANVCKSVGPLSVSNWVGKLSELTTNGDGNGVIEINIGKNVSVKTWNNALSDISDQTLIAPSSPVFAAAMKLKKGQAVKFAGTFVHSDVDCFEEASMTLAGSISEPAYIFRFTNLQAVD